jgi:hypothetical protein
MEDIRGLTSHASRVNGTVSVAAIPWRFTYLCWNIPRVASTGKPEVETPTASRALVAGNTQAWLVSAIEAIAPIMVSVYSLLAALRGPLRFSRAVRESTPSVEVGLRLPLSIRRLASSAWAAPATHQGGTTFADGVQGFSASGSGVSGESDSGVGVRAFSTSATGLVAEGDTLVPGTIGLIAAGNAHAAIFNCKVLVNGDFAVSGKKSAVVPFPDGSHRRLYCLESPESWFEDFGFAELVNGHAHVRLDPDFSAVVDNDTYHVFITEYEHNNALYVTKRTSTSFEVRTNASTMASGTFSYRVVSKRKDILAPRFEKMELPAESRESIKDRQIPKRPRGGGAAKPGNSRSEIS